jgi:glycosyltransferase involved in cell wall biosynthesis
MDTYHIGFVLEQALGHKTHAQNLKYILEQQNVIQPHWILPDWQTDGWLGRLPFLRSNWTMHAGLQAKFGLKALWRKIHLDGLFFHTQVPAVINAGWVRRYPTVISLDATPVQYDQLGNAYQHKIGPEWLEALKTRLNRDCFHAARHLVTWSHWAKNSLVENYGVPEEKITVISPGVDVSTWKRPMQTNHQAGVVKILFVGGDFTRKGGEDLLMAFQLLKAKRVTTSNGPRLELHMVTQTPLQGGIDIYIYPHMQPNSPALKQLYYDADIFCLPSHGDCLPMALAEAGAAGLPLVSTRMAAIPELVQEQVNGLLIEPGNIPQLVEVLDHLIDDPQLRQAMGQQSRRIVVEEHSVIDNANRLIHLICSSLDNVTTQRIAYA